MKITNAYFFSRWPAVQTIKMQEWWYENASFETCTHLKFYTQTHMCIWFTILHHENWEKPPKIVGYEHSHFARKTIRKKYQIHTVSYEKWLTVILHYDLFCLSSNLLVKWYRHPVYFQVFVCTTKSIVNLYRQMYFTILIFYFPRTPWDSLKLNTFCCHIFSSD